MRPLHALLAACTVLLPLVPRAADPPPPPAWPDVLVIDDFEAGLDNWHNDDTGSLELVDDAPQGKHALRWTAYDDGIGHLVYRELTRQKIDFSQYQLLTFRVKLEGKKAWNVNPIVQQYPAVYGYRGLYYSVDTLMPFGSWFQYSQDLRRWENAWPDTFSPDRQEFQFEIAQLAGSEPTRVYLDDIRLLKNPLGVEKSYAGRWGELPDGSQVTHFRLRLANRGERPLTVAFFLRDQSLAHFTAELPPPLHLLPGETGEVLVRVLASAAVLAERPPWYGETAIVGVQAAEIDGLVLYTELTAGTRPPQPAHPCILANPDRVKEWRRQWNDPALRKEMGKVFTTFVSLAEQALAYEPRYPILAHQGITQCPVDNARLVRIHLDDRPFATYQCPQCGRPCSGPVYDCGMENWRQQHLDNAAAVRNLGFAYAITGRQDFALAAARILRPYIDRYEKIPVMSVAAGSPVFSHTSGAARIGGTFMTERNWLIALAVGLDFIRPAKVLDDEEVQAIGERVFAASGHLMMDHKVGAMNLQWMIASAGLFAGLAADHPNLVARAMYDPHGIVNLMEVGYLPDGNWWENPSYQNVANGIAFPVLATCLNTGILPWQDRFKEIFTAAFRTYGPDGRSPTLGTGGPGGYSYTVNALHSLAPMLTDPELAWVPHNRPIWAAFSGGGQPYDSYLWAATWQSKPQLPADRTVSPIPDATTHMTAYGGIAMRVPGQRNYCWFHYGRELVHGHRNKLSINAYAKGNWFARNIAGGYGDDFKDFLETIASSTSIMVDGGNPDWDTGTLLYQRSQDGIEIAAGRENGAWKDVEHERAVVLTAGPLIVLDRCRAEAEHTYDWLYHSALTNLTLVSEGLMPPVEKLGDTPRYNSLVPQHRFPTVAAAHFTRQDGSGLKLAFVPAGELHAFKALKKHDGLLWRQRGATLGFACVMWPYATGETGEAAIEALPVTDAAGQAAGIDHGQAVRVTTPDGTFTVLVNYAGQPLTAAGLEGTERVTVRRDK